MKKNTALKLQKKIVLLLKLVSDKIIELIFSIHDFSVEEMNLKKKKKLFLYSFQRVLFYKIILNNILLKKKFIVLTHTVL